MQHTVCKRYTAPNPCLHTGCTPASVLTGDQARVQPRRQQRRGGQWAVSQECRTDANCLGGSLSLPYSIVFVASSELAELNSQDSEGMQSGGHTQQSRRGRLPPKPIAGPHSQSPAADHSTLSHTPPCFSSTPPLPVRAQINISQATRSEQRNSLRSSACHTAIGSPVGDGPCCCRCTMATASSRT